MLMLNLITKPYALKYVQCLKIQTHVLYPVLVVNQEQLIQIAQLASKFVFDSFFLFSIFSVYFYGSEINRSLLTVQCFLSRQSQPTNGYGSSGLSFSTEWFTGSNV